MPRFGSLSHFAIAGVLATSVAAQAAPSFILTTNTATDISADGNTTVSAILDANVQRLVKTYTRGVGFTTLGTAAPAGPTAPRISDDLPRSACTTVYDGTYGPVWNQATFGLYNNGGTLVGHTMAHRYDPGTNTWVHTGGWPSGTGGAGKGSSTCDAFLNEAYDISSNGRFVVGSGQWGVYGSSACQPRGFIYDNNNGSMKILPLIGVTCLAYPWCYGVYVSTNGLTILGLDSHTGPSDPAGITGPVTPFCDIRALTVWERANDTSEFLASGETLLDTFGGGTGVLTRSGTMVAATLSSGKAQYVLANTGLAGDLVKYTKSGGVWVMTDLGRVSGSTGDMTPTGISDDGNTIVGNYGGGSFFWRASLNGGVPMDLQTYVNSLNGGVQFPPAGTGTLSGAYGCSADGNAIMSVVFLPNPCPPDTGITLASQSGTLYLNGVPCEQPRFSGGPYSQVASSYLPLGLTANVWVAGSFPMTLQWQKETPTGSGNWANLSDSCGTFAADNSWTYEGTSGFQLRINELAGTSARDGNYRVIASNCAGSATSPVASLSVLSGACCYVPSGGGAIVCSVEMQSRCVGDPAISYQFGGVYLGDNTVCAPSACNAVLGACCYGSGGSGANCAIDIASHCVLAVAAGGTGGSFAGVGSTCTPAACLAQSVPCCYSPDDLSNAVCTIELQSYCVRARKNGGLSGTVGTGTTCAPSACSGVTGACCFSPSTVNATTLTITTTSDVICSIQTQTHCTNQLLKPSEPGYVVGLQGLFAGTGVTCTPSNLCSAVDGACCYTLDTYVDSVCTVQLQSNCTNSYSNWGLGGAYGGTGSTCVSYNCSASTGACCHTATGDTCAVCTITPAARCTTAINIGGMGGTYAGNGSVCTPSNCAAAASGACCVDTDCLETCAADCTITYGGVPAGAGTTCPPSGCAILGTCCYGSICQANVTPANCTGPKKLFVASTTTCNAGGNLKTPCCKADYNHVGGITVQDIFDFLGAFFLKDITADINGATPAGGAGVTVQDIFDFLAAYFAKGC